jgi:cullin 1
MDPVVETAFTNMCDLVLNPLEAYLDGKTITFDKVNYGKVSTMVYELANKRKDDMLYGKIVAKIKDDTNARLSNEFNNLRGEELLHSFTKLGETQEFSNKFYKNQFEYLSRNFIKNGRKQTFEEVRKTLFKQIIYDNVKHELARQLLSMIKDQRDGNVIDQDIVRKVTKFMGELGLRCYEDDFEKPFLHQSSEYYKTKSNLWIDSDSVTDFLKKVDNVLKIEKHRVNTLLRVSTEPKLVQVLEKELLKNKVVTLMHRENTGLKYMLLQDRLEEMELFYKFVIRLGEGAEEMSKLFKDHIISLGNQLLEERRQREELSEREKIDISDDPELISGIVHLHEKYERVLTEQFARNGRFTEALNQAFVHLINNGNGKKRLVEILATHTDNILRNKLSEKMTDNELEIRLGLIGKLFFYVQDKDIFGGIYREKLASRLMNKTSFSDDLERFFIAKLKMLCGQEFTSHFESMMFDMINSRDIDKEFQIFYENQLKNDVVISSSTSAFATTVTTVTTTEPTTEPLPLSNNNNNNNNNNHMKLLSEFSIQVLTYGNWPSYNNFEKLILPKEMQDTANCFQIYYLEKNNGKRLIWVYELGSVVIKANYGRPQEKREFQMTFAPLQATVLMYLYTEHTTTSKSFQEIGIAICIEDEPLKRVLDSLTFGKYPILVRNRLFDPKDKTTRSIKTDDLFTINRDFKCSSRRFQVSMPSLTNMKTTERVEEDRKHVIEACIVRIMKARKVLKHTTLISEVLNQLQLFRPDPKFVRRLIESLIERDYLERDAEDLNTYKYVAEIR